MTSVRDNPVIERATRLWNNPRWQSLWTQPAAIESWIEQQQMAVTAIAAPTNFEGLRGEWLLRQWSDWGLDAALDEVGNVIGLRTGSDLAAPALALTAHTDTAFPPGTPAVPERRSGRLWAPGIGDNGTGLAALLALMRILHENAVVTRTPLLFVANVGEEGEGDLRGMRHLFRPGGPWAARIGCTLVLDGPGTDQITTVALPSRRFRLIFEGSGGHSWSNLGRASAAHAAVRTGAALLAQVQPRAEELGCNIGWMQGGSAINAIAAEAQLRLDLRARASVDLDALVAAVRRALAHGVEAENAAALSGTVHGRMETLGDRPGGELSPDSPLLHLVRHVDQLLGITAAEQCASTDANIPLAQGRPALRLGAGGQGGGAHTLQEWFDPSGRALALQRILLLIAAWANAELPTPAPVPAHGHARSRR